jgi:predicted RNase H-like nuclease (RuvC/YqgF family)
MAIEMKMSEGHLLEALFARDAEIHWMRRYMANADEQLGVLRVENRELKLQVEELQAEIVDLRAEIERLSSPVTPTEGPS